MADSTRSTSKRLLRILVGGSILAAAWVAFDAVTHSDAASAAEFPDVTLSHISAVATGTASDIASDVVDPVVARAVSLAEKTTSETMDATDHVAVAIGSTSRAVMAPVAEALSSSLAPVAAALTDTLAAIPPLPILATAGALLAGGGSVLIVALAASTAPLLPTPAGGVPRDPPAVPPTIDQFGAAAVLGSHLYAPPGSALASRAAGGATPLSPNYAFDTTPD